MTDTVLYVLFIGALILSVVAQIKVSTTFRKYSQISSGSGRTGAEVARRILDAHGLFNVKIEMINGELTDHYDPRTKVLRLSRSVYSSSSSSAVGVAAHEVGHAIQHAVGYKPLVIRTRLVPAVSFASRFSWIAIMLGFLVIGLSQVYSAIGMYILFFGIILFAVTTLFHLVTLPVEVNASGRALRELELTGWYTNDELKNAKSVLSAAAMTYIAALAVSVLQLLRLLSMFRSRD
jgi:Zn-dependent membrane protease YugP